MIVTLWGVLANVERPPWPPCWGRRTWMTPAVSSRGPSGFLDSHRSSGSCNWHRDPPQPHGDRVQHSGLWNIRQWGLFKVTSQLLLMLNWKVEVLGGTELSLDWLLIQLIQQNFVRKRLGQQLKAAKAVDTNSFYLEKIMDYTLHSVLTSGYVLSLYPGWSGPKCPAPPQISCNRENCVQ